MFTIFSKRKESLFTIILISGIVFAILAKAQFGRVFEYSREEGNRLMVVSLFLKGFSLYKEIWLNQTPLFTLILAFWFKLVGSSVYHGRVLVLFFSGILLWALYQTIKIQWGRLSAFISVIFLILSNIYLRMSVSVMLGIPSAAFVILSVYYLSLYRKLYSNYLLALSGVFMALSLQIKLFTIFLLPSIFLELRQIEHANSQAKKEQGFIMQPFFLWFGSFLTVYLAIALIFFGLNFRLFFNQLLEPHLTGAIILTRPNFSVIWGMILTDYEIAFLVLLGIILLIRQKKSELLFPVLWLVSAFIILLNYRQILGYYYTLISIPMCWLAAISFGDFFRIDIRQGWFTKKNKYGLLDVFLRWLTASLIIWTILLIPIKCYRTYVELKGSDGKAALQEQFVVNLLKKYKPYSSWVVTERPIFAFYADMLAPPGLSIICPKRRFISETEQDYFIEMLKKYKVKLIILNLIPPFYGPKAISYIKENYDNIYKGKIFSPLWSIKLSTSPFNVAKSIYRTWFMHDKDYLYRCFRFQRYEDVEFYISKDLSSR